MGTVLMMFILATLFFQMLIISGYVLTFIEKKRILSILFPLLIIFGYFCTIFTMNGLFDNNIENICYKFLNIMKNVYFIETIICLLSNFVIFLAIKLKNTFKIRGN